MRSRRLSSSYASWSRAAPRLEGFEARIGRRKSRVAGNRFGIKARRLITAASRLFDQSEVIGNAPARRAELLGERELAARQVELVGDEERGGARLAQPRVRGREQDLLVEHPHRVRDVARLDR